MSDFQECLEVWTSVRRASVVESTFNSTFSSVTADLTDFASYVYCARDLREAEPVMFSGPTYPRLLLQSEYKWENPKEIATFLSQHAEIGAVMDRAYEAILRHFRSIEEAALQVALDPSEPGEPELYAIIRTNLPIDQARERLREFESQWWFSQPHSVRRTTHFVVE